MLHINGEIIKGETIHDVCSAGNVSFLEMLIDVGVDVNLRDSDGRTPLHKAVRANHEDVIRCLMEHGADPNSRTDGSGEPVLHYAIVRSSDVTVETLVSAGCSLNLRSRSGESPMHVAISENRFETVKLLCEKGANLRIINRKGLTIVQVALQLRKYDILNYFMEINAFLEEPSSSHETLLLMAARLDGTESIEVIGQLFKSGYDVINDSWIWNNNASVFSGDTGRYLRTYLQSRAAEVQPLRQLVCYKIRKCIGICLPRKINSLPLPQILKNCLKLNITNTEI